MSSLKIVVLLVVSLLMMQVNLGLAKNKSISFKITRTQSDSGALSIGTAGTALTGLTVTINIGTLKVGGPGPNTIMMLDTEKSDLWVIDNTCTNAYCTNGGRTRYNRLATTTFSDRGQSVNSNYLFGQYQISGVTGNEQLTFPVNGGNQIVNSQDFIRVSKTVGFTTGNAFDGFIGLAPGKNIPNRLSLIERMFNAGIISSKTFTIYAAAATLDIGEVPAATGALNYVNTVTRGLWDFRVTQININNNLGSVTTHANNVVVRIETMVSGTGIPRGPLKAIAKQLGATLNPLTGLYNINCGALATTFSLDFVINGQTYSILIANIINAPPGAPCTLNFIETSNWVLGQAFLVNFATVYNADTNKIGFASIP